MKAQKERKSQKEKKKKSQKKYENKVFRTQKFQNSINVSVRQCQHLLNVRVRL